MGIFLGLFSSAAYGLIPLFTLPLLQAGIPAQTALVYRFAIASVVMWAILFFKKEKILISSPDLLKITILSSMYLFAVVLFFYAFSFLSSGAVATIQFLFPVMVMLIMIIFFKERFYWHIALAVFLAILGVMFLSLGPELGPALEPGFAHAPRLPFGSDLFWGITLSLLAGLCNALYFVGLQVARIPHINGLVLTFYIMLFGTIFCFFNALASNGLQWIGTWWELFLAFMLAVVTAVISNLTLIIAVKLIGSTMSSILGVMEPVTAVTVGVLVFGEPFTMQLVGGMVLIIFSVLLVILGPRPESRKIGTGGE